ncbi:hypothetical protein B0H19DRAFT_1060337 [Mycena capillaripes]|nr:hypothetical protein B0H19DRAFT_1060337 [Mycena capillaripes]
MVHATPGVPNTFTVTRVVVRRYLGRSPAASNGPTENWHWAEYYTKKGLGKNDGKWPGIEKGRQRRQRKGPSDNRSKLPDDATLENEFYKMLVKLDAHQEVENEREVKPSFGEFQVKRGSR